MQVMKWSLIAAAVAAGSTQLAFASAQSDSKGFVEDASATLLLRNTSVVNLLDGCALSLPCHQQGELPVGLMVWHGALRDDTVLNAGLQMEKVLQKQ